MALIARPLLALQRLVGAGAISRERLTAFSAAKIYGLDGIDLDSIVDLGFE
ncbi:hypothetical protein ACF1A9_25250 [Streptomyces sp. NPDC014872]|uniref:hypothetical protein n=1 Tax=Streptomyces sp. NPDC014872 TaxID=3364926 RepID=UPI0036F6AECB